MKSIKKLSFSGEIAVLVYLATFKLLIHFLTNGNYGYFGDELYYIACGKHLDFGYIDLPPFTPFISNLSLLLFGDSVFAIRIFPALSGALLVILVGLMVRELGGGRFAQLLAALAIIIGPAYLGVNGLLTPNTFDILFWTLGAYSIILIIKYGEPGYFLLLGASVGFGMMNKLSLIFFIIGTISALLLTSNRKLFATRWFWYGALLSLIIFLPHIIWQIQHHWPTIDFFKDPSRFGVSDLRRRYYVIGQILYHHPLILPVWLSGIYYLFFTAEGRRYCTLGWIFTIVFCILLMLRSKIYYLVPAFPMIIAAGSLAVERFFRERGVVWLRPVIITTVVIGGILTAPVFLPVLPYEKYQSYIKPFKKYGFWGVPELSYVFAGRFGWEEMTAKVASVYHSLPPEEQSECIIYAENYNQAAAVDFFGGKYNIPGAVCRHVNYFYWGPGDSSGNVLIALGIRMEELKSLYSQVKLVHVFNGEYTPLKNLNIYICREPNISLKDAWSELGIYHGG